METTFHVEPALRQPGRRVDLDALARLDGHALRALYGKGTVPSDLGVLEGHPRGRMLAVRTLDRGMSGRVIHSIASAAAFPWGGKSFFGDGDRGTGINRVHVFGRHQMFPFQTSLRRSVMDDGPCVVLDYDLPDNPSLIRSIHDEIREVHPGVYLGPAMWKTTAGPRLVLWFALDTCVQAAPIGSA
jgi:hypothetical protein